MAGVEDNQTPSRRNLSELLYIYSFVQTTSMVTALVLAYAPLEASVLFISYPFMIALVILGLPEGAPPCVYIAQSIFIGFLQLAFYCSSRNNLGYVTFYAGVSLITLSVIRFYVAGPFYCLRKQFPGNADIGHLSTRSRIVVLHFLSLFLGDGFTMFSLWCLNRRDQRWRIACLVSISVVGFGSFCCCIHLLVHRWREHRKKDVQVSAVISQG